MYGLDGPVLLLMPLLWLVAATRPALWLCAVALAVDAVFVVEVLGDLGWFLDQDKRWLHVLLTALPAVAVCGWTLPRLVRGRLAADLWTVVPVKAAALCAVLNLFFAFVPYERLTVGVLAASILPAAVLLGMIVVLHRLGRPRGLVAQVAVGTGMTFVLVTVLVVVATTTSTVTGYVADDVTAARTRAERVAVRTGKVTVEGDDLYFEVRGSGPPLLMIPGGQGDAGFYTYPAALLADEFQVITYDRRGNSRSTRNVTDFDITQQARDAVAVLRAVGHDSAAVFGNSGGAIIALEMASRFPGAVSAVVAHEPPLLSVEPDRKSLALFDAVDRTSRTFGSESGMFMFASSVGIPIAAYQNIPSDFSTRIAANQAFFVEHEMQDFVHHEPGMAALKSGNVPIVLAVGASTLAAGRYYGRPAGILAEKLDAPLVVFPGHHMSYFDLPTAWTSKLRDTLHTVGSPPKR